MKGYKASINGICRDFKFEVGKTYEIEGELELCKNGFHFCKTIADTAMYYYYGDSNNIYFEVEAVGEVVSEENDKYATNKLKILRIVDPNHDGTLHIKDGKLHREDGPACEYSNGTKHWYLDGKLHREDGPAFEYSDGTKHWYLDGEGITEEEFNKQINI